MSLQISALQLDEKAQWLEWEQGYCRWRNQVFVIFWITYAAFYLCRVNFFIAIPDIIREYGWSKSQMGVIGTAFFWQQ
jgi:OPA family glycerol-3-phosphate transporter-like MFS transporter